MKLPRARLGMLVDDLSAGRLIDVMPDDLVTDPTIASATHTISASATHTGAEVKVRKRVRIEPGDLVFSRLHTQNGSFAFSSGRFQATSTFLPLAVREEKVDRRYLFWALHKYVPSLSATDTVGRETFKVDDILGLEIPLPKLDEQKRIARILDRAEEVLCLRRRAASRLQRVVPALFFEMFGTPWSEHGKWPQTTISGLGRVVTGNTPPRAQTELYGDTVEWVKTNDIDPLSGAVRRATEGLSALGAKQGRVVPKGSVLVTCIAGSLERIGDAAIVDREVAINQQINAILPAEGVDSVFLWQLVRVLHDVIQNRATGVMTRLVNKTTLENVPAILPPLELQREFAAKAKRVRALEVSQASGEPRAREFMKALMHHLFAGTA